MSGPRAIGAEQALQAIEEIGVEAPRTSLPALIAGLERVKVALMMRALTPELYAVSSPDEDRLVGPAEAAKLLGISKSTLYKISDRFDFVVRQAETPGRLQFSARGIQRHLSHLRGDGGR